MADTKQSYTSTTSKTGSCKEKKRCQRQSQPTAGQETSIGKLHKIFLFYISNTSIIMVNSYLPSSFNSSSCDRKRLEGKEFSTKAMENWRSKQKPLRCKQCVDKAAKDERDLSAAKAMAKAKEASAAPVAATSASASVSSAGVASAPSADPELALCFTCKNELPLTQFNNTQLRKGDQVSSSRCS